MFYILQIIFFLLIFITFNQKYRQKHKINLLLIIKVEVKSSFIPFNESVICLQCFQEVLGCLESNSKYDPILFIHL